MKCLALAAALTAAAASQTEIGRPPGPLVDIGGRRLHAICSGAGSPTVVLAAGASSVAIDWSLVQRTRIALDTELEAVPETVPAAVVAESAEGQRVALATLRDAGSRAEPAWGDRPLVVLSRGVDLPAAARDVHASLGRLTRNFRHTVVDGSGHEVHLFQPAAVIRAIEDVVAAVRTGSRLR